MHAHRIQFDPNSQISALYAAARAEAKREAQRTRKKLRSFAVLLGDDEDHEGSVTGIGSHEGSSGQQQQSSQHPRAQPSGRQAASPQTASGSFSTYG